MRFNRKFFYDADGGNASAVGGEDTNMQNNLDATVESLQRPKYLDQVSPTKRDSDEYKTLYKYGKLEDLADAMINTAKENESLKKNSDRALIVPDPTDEEGVKAFYSKLGVPEKADNYKLSALGEIKTDSDKFVADIIRKSSFEAKLTDKQANHIAAMMVSIARQGAENLKNAADLKRKNMDADLIASYDDITADIDKQKAAERDRASYNSLIEEAGLKELFDDIGVTYNPKAVKALASYARKHSGTALTPDISNGQNKNDKKLFSYGTEFNNFYKR